MAEGLSDLQAPICFAFSSGVTHDRPTSSHLESDDGLLKLLTE